MAASRRPLNPTADVDRRGALRHPVKIAGSLSSSSQTPITVELTDISDLGCQIVRPAELTRDTTLCLSFGGFTFFDAIVVWTSPKAAGLRFEQPMHPALIAQVVAAAAGRRPRRRLLAPDLVRREERKRLWHLDLPALCQIGVRPTTQPNTFRAKLSDLSTEGCRIISGIELSQGTVLLVTIGERWPLLGIVRWSEDDAIGLQFCDVLPSGTVESISSLTANGPALSFGA